MDPVADCKSMLERSTPVEFNTAFSLPMSGAVRP